MIRKAFKMTLNPGEELEYRRRHNPIWPELRDVLEQHGVHNYSIFLDPSTGSLFAYAELESEVLWQKIAQHPVCRRWWAYMKDLMSTNADNSPATISLEEMFHLD